ncbi:SdrD B-like domain-containing protein, partial [Klebsiella pneumoniae]|uniref:SdrD B-like domain-containing protein n=1 Tax=Klebsiella pneumoniae TaxID=573 RepID=UPI00132F7CC9
LNAGGQIVATGVTGSNGFYTFSNLAAGTYSVQYITPGAYSVRAGGYADATTGISGSFSLSAGQGYGVPYQLVT